MSDIEHERIWLEPICQDAAPEGRLWCPHKLGDCDDPGCGAKAVEFIRADLAADTIARLRAALVAIGAPLPNEPMPGDAGYSDIKLAIFWRGLAIAYRKAARAALGGEG